MAPAPGFVEKNYHSASPISDKIVGLMSCPDFCCAERTLRPGQDGIPASVMLFGYRQEEQAGVPMRHLRASAALADRIPVI